MGEIRIVGPGKTHGYPIRCARNSFLYLMADNSVVMMPLILHTNDIVIWFCIILSGMPLPANFQAQDRR